MFRIAEKGEEESGGRYAITEEKNLGNNRKLSKELVKHKKTPFNRVVIADRTITLNN